MINGEANKIPFKMQEQVLRKMNHREWLMQAAVMFETQWAQNAVEMTPFRVGLITRLKLASEYIDLLEKDIMEATRRVEASTSLVNQANDKIQELITAVEHLTTDNPAGR